MAQIELRFFNPSIDSEVKRTICDVAQTTVFRVHYPDDVPARRTGGGGILLKSGDITLAVPILDTSFSISDADYELEISEGSDNWPADADGEYLAGKAAAMALEQRAERISSALAGVQQGLAHNIFEVNGQATGWVQYKPDGTIA